MGWKSDADAQEMVKIYLINQKHDLDNLLQALFRYNDGTPIFQFLQLFGKFVFTYSEFAETYTESEAWDLTLAEIMNDPVIQQLSAQMVGDQLDRRLKNE
tara:strand:- start:1421 stop:1720 length:300 start_codon:yes stop_codon:yes gene_type:complete